MNWRKVGSLVASISIIGAVSSVGIRVEGQRSVGISAKVTEDPKQVLTILKQTRLEQRNEAESEDFVRFRGTCAMYIADDKVSPKFVELNNKLWSAYAKSDYEQCASIAEQMEPLLPKEAGDDSLEGRDYRAAWRAGIGDFRAWACDYDGALRDYEKARKLEPSLEGGKSKRFSGVKHAAYGQAKMEALLARSDASINHLNEAPALYFSGCGNCMEGERHGIDRLSTVYRAGNLPPSEAEVALLKLVADGYVPLSAEINPDRSRDERREAAELADFFLGELYRKQGKRELARAAYLGVAERKYTDDARMARTRLATL